MDIKDLPNKLHITITDNPNGNDPPTLRDDNGYSTILWSSWGKKLNLTNGKGYLIYVSDKFLDDAGGVL